MLSVSLSVWKMQLIHTLNACNYMRNVKPISNDPNEMLFREVNGTWIQVNRSNNDSVVVLADLLSINNVLIDDDAQFVRIERYTDYGKWCFEYRKYGGTIRININIYNDD